ncbi:MAG: ribosomal RNA small subunit methyltransferase H [Candidatus Tyloplasma litorale]|nr:MAG: ribosomal RNA small subunit methyltransferase H [Mycoplasmatales bacterium]
MKHYSVLSNEVIKKLNIKKDGIYIDCTLGLGGHTSLIAKKANKGKVVAFDQDPNAMSKAKENLSKYKNILYVEDNFKNIKINLEKLGIKKVDGILYDLGTSYYQLTDEKRGFTYHGESTLDMRMNPNQNISAINILNEYSKDELAEIFFKYGNEKKSHKLAQAIVDYRKNNKITLNTQLNEIIKSVKGFIKDKHPSKNIFQAIRIEVNDEMNVIKKSLNDSIELLKKNGVITVITFHSLEDRIVKKLFWEKKEDIDITNMGNIHKFKTNKVIYPTKKEIEINKASRSAKLRTLVKLEE